MPEDRKQKKEPTPEAAPPGSDRVARLVAEALDERKGEDIVILGMAEVLPLTDYFVIATGRNARHVDALIENVEQRLKEHGIHFSHRSGRDARTWVLLDYGWVVVHVFQQEARDYYDLELRWGDAERVPLPEGVGEPEAGE